MAVSTGDTRRDASPMVDDGISVEPTPRQGLLTQLGFPADLRPGRELGLVMLVVAPILTVIYRLWDVVWRVPFVYDGDGLTTAAYTKALIERPWYFTNPRLAAPFVADWRDFPVGGENLHWLALKILGVASGDYGIATNAYFFLSFFAIAITSYLVARYLRLGRAASLVVAVLYAFLPYHAYRNVGHLARGVYYIMPVVVLVMLWAIDYRTELCTTDGTRLRWRRGRVVFALVVCLLLGASDTQNAVFMVSILGVAALVTAIVEWDWRPIAVLVAMAAVTMGSLTVNNAPYFFSRQDRGANAKVARRSLEDQDGFALRPVSLILPAAGHRIGALARITQESSDAQATNSESGGTALGVVGSVGLLVSLGALLAAAIGSRRRSETRDRLARLGMLNVVAILIGTIGGFAFLLALAGFRQYRSWNRISLFVAFFSLLAAGLLLDRAFAWIRRRPWPASVTTGIVVVLAGLLVVGGAFDQITPNRVPDYAATAKRFHQDAAFYQRLERRLPRGAMVFDLPVSSFPEPGPIANMTDYAELAGYLHTDHLRFSYGGMKGRQDGDWQRNLATCDPKALMTQVTAIGFDAAVLDTRGYEDGGTAFLAAVRPLLGKPVDRSADGHLVAFDLAPYRARMQAAVGADTMRAWRDAALETSPVWHGFSYEEPSCEGSRRWSTQPDASLTFTNPTRRPQSIVVSSDIEAAPSSSALSVRAPGVDETVTLDRGRGRIMQPLVVPPGSTTMRFHLTGPQVDAPNDSRTLYFALLRSTFDPPGAPTPSEWAHSAAATG